MQPIAPLLLAVALAAPAPQELRVSAAASLADVLAEIVARWTAQGGEPAVLNLGASGTLARQIEAGAPADVFVAADADTVAALERAGRTLAGSRRTVATNALVVAVPADARFVPAKAADLARPEIRRLALADPAAAPAGVYARRWLERAGVWTAVASKVIPLDNVRAARAAVEAGNVDAAVVYLTDVLPGRPLRVAFRVPAAEAPPVHYPAVVLSGARAPARARAFVEYLAGPEARAVFARHGFGAAGAEPR